jgi:capsular polysaccharide transport system permease protein
VISRMLKQLNVQRRVIGALLIREIHGRFRREGLGFGWLFGEPLMFALPVLTLWSVVRSRYEHGVPFMAIFVSGYMGILLFRHVGASMLMFVRSNANLLYHRQITLLDVFLAKLLMEVVGNVTALVVVYGIFILAGRVEFPVNLPMLYLGYLFMIWWCATVGLLAGALSERSKIVEKVWPVYSYTYLFYSGFFYMADWLPPKLREIALYQPSLQAYEMMRQGMLGSSVRTYASPAYTALVLAILTVIGLWAMRDARKHVVLNIV